MYCSLTILVLFRATAAAAIWIRVRYLSESKYHSALDRRIHIQSAAFADGESIPDAHTCRGESLSPPLAWSNLPPGTKSLALIVTDEDLPFPEFAFFNIVHWVLYDVPVTMEGLAAGVTDEELDQAGIRRTRTWSRSTRYYPPCPMYGNHRYAFRLYALDEEGLSEGIRSRTELLKSMRGHILAYGELNGYCRR